MNAVATPPGRRSPGFGDHVLAYVATLAMTAVAGATGVMAASLAERVMGPPEGFGLVAVLWVYGVNLMRAPILIWPLLAVGIVLFTVLRQVGMGGWLSAVVIAVAIALLVGLNGAATLADALIRVAIAITVALIWWKIMDLWTSRPRGGGRSPEIN
jgi:hypothetical protein